MSEPTIICPNCKTEIKLTESLAAPLIESTRREYQKQLAQKDADVAKRDAALREREVALTKAQQTIDDQVAEKLKLERGKIAVEEAKKAKLILQTDIDQKTQALADLQEVVNQQNVKLTEAQKAQADLLRKQRELDDAKRELELTVEKRVQEGLATTREQAKKEAEEGLRLKVMEAEQTISSMQKQIEELKRKAEQGSQQLQGEVQELELEALLRAKFPRDTIEPVPKGEHGGDVLQHVVGPNGQPCGTIIWESKRTKNWSDGWLAKLREDQRAAKAEIAVIVSQSLPKEIETFGLVENVWVTHTKTVLPVALTLRHTLIEVASARQASEGQQTKTEMVYQYLTGPRFRHRVEAIVEAFSSMQEDLDKEKKAIIKQWAKREEQIDRVMQATAGMYGDLQGIAGKTIQEIEGLELRALNPPASHPTDADDRIGNEG
ncbi:conserved hypothetical protein [Nitrospira sp. ND1]|uniref:DUF2130 domain-containing protein n=1 Tax=Nitrospira sp. ND1 TaxID=1658518 RepID=UPI0009B9A6D4|nr:DUF2130 domain-containing protein [Nitrospira sp. ND1]SLM44224.1 conserved hypothetical protein [Nitrospira sp. ND1]